MSLAVGMLSLSFIHNYLRLKIFSNLDVSLTFIEDVGPGHEAGIPPVVLFRRVVVIGFASEVRNAGFL